MLPDYPEFDFEGDDEDDDDRRDLVRTSDPPASHEAAEGLDLSRSRAICWELFQRYTALPPHDITSTELRFRYYQELRAQGWADREAYNRAESVRRRIHDLSLKFGLIEYVMTPEGKIAKRGRAHLYRIKNNNGHEPPLDDIPL